MHGYHTALPLPPTLYDRKNLPIHNEGSMKIILKIIQLPNIKVKYT